MGAGARWGLDWGVGFMNSFLFIGGGRFKGFLWGGRDVGVFLGSRWV